MGADEHVHERALAHGEPERVAKHAAQAFVGQGLESLVVDRQRVNARPERRRRRNRRRGGFGLRAAMRTSARVAAMAHDVRFQRRYFDLVVFADQIPRIAGRKRAAALIARFRRVIADLVGIIRQPPNVRLMPELRPAGSGVLALLLLVRRGRLGRGARGFVGALKPKHQLDQLLLAELLQISPIHPLMDSDFAARGKGVGNYAQGNRVKELRDNGLKC